MPSPSRMESRPLVLPELPEHARLARAERAARLRRLTKRRPNQVRSHRPITLGGSW